MQSSKAASLTLYAVFNASCYIASCPGQHDVESERKENVKRVLHLRVLVSKGVLITKPSSDYLAIGCLDATLCMAPCHERGECKTLQRACMAFTAATRKQPRQFET